VSDGRDVTIYADGARNIEVVRISNDPSAPVARIICEAVPGGSPESHGFKLRRGDFLIVRVEE
jgi:hypothetical protein